ncbi:flagellar biosynthesis anti-sigma factor FlgM [Parasphingorhabdus sp.]|uniref:flagellar biosynthesis anti-sigma factor FlgM n=1 Tax=Parasphingorhabdus sp. TaxID=2709688 RepID=UPI0030022594
MLAVLAQQGWNDMKPVDSYSAMKLRLERPALNDPGAKPVKGAEQEGKADTPSAISLTAAQLERAAAAETAKSVAAAGDVKISASITTTVSKLAADKPPFDIEKVADIKRQIASGSYQVDTDALALKMLDAGVLGVDSKK